MATVSDTPLAKMFSSLAASTARAYLADIKGFIKWLSQRDGWRDLNIEDLEASAKILIQRQKENAIKGDDEEYVISDLLLEYINSLTLSYNSADRIQWSVRGLFDYNRASLPKDKKFRIIAKKEPIEQKLTMDHVKIAIAKAGMRDKSIILFKYQSFLDTEGLWYASNKLTDHIVERMRAGDQIIQIKIPGRKIQKNIKAFYTFIGADAIHALRDYFDSEYGVGKYPPSGSPLWIKRGKASPGITKPSITHGWTNLLKDAGLIKREEKKESYGMGIHNMRDIARTYLHVKALKDGLDLAAIEFCMGHTDKLDPNRYDSFAKNEPYVLGQYKIAIPYLNIISNPPMDEKTQEKIIAQDQRIAVLSKNQKYLTECRIREIDAAIADMEQDQDDEGHTRDSIAGLQKVIDAYKKERQELAESIKE